MGIYCCNSLVQRLRVYQARVLLLCPEKRNHPLHYTLCTSLVMPPFHTYLSLQILHCHLWVVSCSPTSFFWLLFIIQTLLSILYILNSLSQRLIDHKCVGLFLGSLFCSIDLWVCFSASTMLLWLLYLCSIVQNQGQWLLQFCSSFSRLPWLFRVLCASIPILKPFALVLWEMPLVFWKELQWFCKLPWALIRKEELYPRKWGKERVLERILWDGEGEWKGRIRG